MAARWRRRTFVWAALAVLGCSQGDPSPSSSGPQASSVATPAPAGAATPTPSVPAQQVETPDGVVQRFLEALRSGDQATVAALLTTAAQQETVRLGYEINPPGDPSSKYEVGRVQLVDGQPQEAFVSSVWTQDLGNGETFSFEAVWIAKREEAGWRVSGLAVKDPESEEPLVFDFEKLEEVFEKKELVEQSAAADDSARQALNPSSASLQPPRE